MRAFLLGEARQFFDRLDKHEDLIAEAYFGVTVGDIAYVRPEDASTLEDFQELFAVAEEWQWVGLIEILENYYGEDGFLPALRFRRLK